MKGRLVPVDRLGCILFLGGAVCFAIGCGHFSVGRSCASISVSRRVALVNVGRLRVPGKLIILALGLGFGYRFGCVVRLSDMGRSCGSVRPAEARGQGSLADWALFVSVVAADFLWDEDFENKRVRKFKGYL